MALIGDEVVYVYGVSPTGDIAAYGEPTTTQTIADLGGGGSSSSFVVVGCEMDAAMTSGLTYGYKAGTVHQGLRLGLITAGTLTLLDDAVQIIYVDPDTFLPATSPSDPAAAAFILALVTTAGGSITGLRQVGPIADAGSVPPDPLGFDPSTTNWATGVYGYKGGQVFGYGQISAGTVSVPADSTYNIIYDPVASSVSASLSPPPYAIQMATVLTDAGGAIVSIVDARAFLRSIQSPSQFAISDLAPIYNAGQDGLNFTWQGGWLQMSTGPVFVTAGSIVVTDDSTSYVSCDDNGIVVMEASVNTANFFMAQVDAASGIITVIADGRAFAKVPGTPTQQTSGTWTPELAFDGDSTGITYLQQEGRYVKTGNTCSVTCLIWLTSKGAQTGNAVIGGLPFAAVQGLGSAGGAASSKWFDVGVATTWPIANVSPGASGIELSQYLPAGPVGMTDADFTNTTALTFTFTYMVTP